MQYASRTNDAEHKLYNLHVVAQGLPFEQSHSLPMYGHSP